jgi:hypothetical protein
MLLLNSEAVAANKAIETGEAHREQTNRWVAQQLAHSVYVSDKTISVANEERQMGKPLGAAEFKTIIEKLHPKLKVEHHPYSDDVCVYFLRRGEPWEFDPKTNVFGGEQKVFVTAVRDTVIPEWSIMSVKQVKEYDDSRHISPGQLGYRWITVPERELTRGWRAVLAKLLNSEIVSLDQVNRVKDKYGSADRESWAANTGQLSNAANPF